MEGATGLNPTRRRASRTEHEGEVGVALEILRRLRQVGHGDASQPRYLSITGDKALENTVRQQAKNLTHIGTELVNG